MTLVEFGLPQHQEPETQSAWQEVYQNAVECYSTAQDASRLILAMQQLTIDSPWQAIKAIPNVPSSSNAHTALRESASELGGEVKPGMAIVTGNITRLLHLANEVQQPLDFDKWFLEQIKLLQFELVDGDYGNQYANFATGLIEASEMLYHSGLQQMQHLFTGDRERMSPEEFDQYLLDNPIDAAASWLHHSVNDQKSPRRKIHPNGTVKYGMMALKKDRAGMIEISRVCPAHGTLVHKLFTILLIQRQVLKLALQPQ